VFAHRRGPPWTSVGGVGVPQGQLGLFRRTDFLLDQHLKCVFESGPGQMCAAKRPWPISIYSISCLEVELRVQLEYAWRSASDRGW
jgi:hypothetical protein